MTISENAQLRERIARLEYAVSFFERHLGIKVPDAPAAVSPEVLALARAGKKMEAIQRHRELTGVGLREAQQVVESLG